MSATARHRALVHLTAHHPALTATRRQPTFFAQAGWKTVAGPWPLWVSVRRAEYVLVGEGWDEATRLTATRQALGLVALDATAAQTDIPWHLRDSWPPSIAHAAQRLRAHFVREDKWAHDYMWTDRVPLADDVARSDFVTFAPHAYDAIIWAGKEVLATPAGEVTSLVVALTDEQRDVLEADVGLGHVVTLTEWRERHPSALRRLLQRLYIR